MQQRKRPTRAPCSSSRDFAKRAFRGQLDADEAASLCRSTRREGAVRLRHGHPGRHHRGADVAALSLRARVRGRRRSRRGRSAVAATRSRRGSPSILWRSVPDAPLMQAAAAGQLATPDEIEAQAVRMLADGRASPGRAERLRHAVARAPEHPKRSPRTPSSAAWSPALAHDLKTETLKTSRLARLSGERGLTELLTSPSSYINADGGDVLRSSRWTGARSTTPAAEDQRQSGAATRSRARGDPHPGQRPRHAGAHVAAVSGPSGQARSRAGPV